MKIAILEDEPQFLRRIANILQRWDDCERIYECTTNDDFRKICASGATIDVLLADLDLPDGSGCDSISYCAESQGDAISIAISAMSDGASVCAAILSGAIGYIHKDDNPNNIIKVIQDALAGQSTISPAIAQTLVTQIQSGDLREPQSVKKPISSEENLLTKRQTEVLSTIAKGYSYEETAKILGLSKNTIPTHIRNIYKKLHSNNKSEAIYEARIMGIIE